MAKKIGEVLTPTKTAYKTERLILNDNGFSLDVEVKYRRIDIDKFLKERYETQLVDEQGSRVVRKRTDNQGKIMAEGSTSYGYFYEDGTRYEGKPIELVFDKEKARREENSKERYIKFLQFLPTDNLLEWVVEDKYEIWAENSGALESLANKLDETGQVALFEFSPNGKVYYGFLYPRSPDNLHFALIMAVARKKENSLTLLKNAMVRGQKAKPKATIKMLEEI